MGGILCQMRYHVLGTILLCAMWLAGSPCVSADGWEVVCVS